MKDELELKHVAVADAVTHELKTERALNITFQNLNYSVKVPAKNPGKKKPFSKKIMVDKTIIRDVSGLFRSGRMTAVMGASGAGKTSLLNVLAGESRTGELTGSLHVNGTEIYGKEMAKISGFVFQDDLLLPTLTVREAIYMSALLRLPNAISVEEKKLRVENIIKQLNLQRCADTIVGDAQQKGISGGERKRTAIAMELVTNPSILFLDEPTSVFIRDASNLQGLDTFTAYSVVANLKTLASSGKTIVATIHQPSSEIFQLFDDLLLLSEGRVIYHGDRDKVIDYFAQRGYQCPSFTNPSDYLFFAILNNEETNTSGIYSRDRTESNQDRLLRMYNEWDRSEECGLVQRRIGEVTKDGIGKDSIKTQSSFYTQFMYLFGRASKNAFRNPMIVRVKFMQTLFISLIIGLIYLDTDDKAGQPAIQDRAGVLFFLAINNVMANTMAMLHIFGGEKLVFARELGAGYYRLPAYFWSKISVEVPLQVVYPVLMSVIIYFMVGLQAVAAKFFILTGFIILWYTSISVLMKSSLSGFALGVFFASIMPNLQIALSTTPLVILPLMLFSGLFVNIDTIPVYFRWIREVSPIRWAFTGLFINEFGGLRIPIDGSRPEEMQISQGPFIPGESVIKTYGFDNVNLATCAGVLAAIVVILMGLAYLGLWRVVAEKSKTVTVKKKPKHNHGQEEARAS